MRILSHDVFFTLVDRSAHAREALMAACRKCLSGHEGAVFFSAGVLAEELARPVNDRDFDVALHVGFRDQASHDSYQEHPRHAQFISEMSANWKMVRVFDSWVEVGAPSL